MLSVEACVAPKIAEWLRWEMQRREWNQSDLSRRVGSSTGVVNQWVNGVRVPSPESCDRLADALGVDLTHVLVLAGHLPATELAEPDPVRAGLLAQLRRAELTPDRVTMLQLLFEQWAKHPVGARRDRSTVRPA